MSFESVVNSSRTWFRKASWLLVMALFLAACAPAATAPEPARVEVTAQAASRSPDTVILPDGSRCEANTALAASDPRLHYTCARGAEVGEDIGLVGAFSFPTDTELTVEPVLINRSGDALELEPLDTLTAPVARVVLEDGTVCLNAGQGATLAFGGERLNYTCESETGNADSEVGLIGPFEQDGETLSATKVTLRRDPQGWMVEASQQMLVGALEMQAQEK